MTLLQKGKQLDPKYKDHPLTGNWKGFRDCHILLDWILVYRIHKDKLLLVLTRTGTHSDLDLRYTRTRICLQLLSKISFLHGLLIPAYWIDTSDMQDFFLHPNVMKKCDNNEISEVIHSRLLHHFRGKAA